jgi:hypothetical protein
MKGLIIAVILIVSLLALVSCAKAPTPISTPSAPIPTPTPTPGPTIFVRADATTDKNSYDPSRFNLKVIKSYFPEFEKEITKV